MDLVLALHDVFSRRRGFIDGLRRRRAALQYAGQRRCPWPRSFRTKIRSEAANVLKAAVKNRE
jgi:hypothetical protein